MREFGMTIFLTVHCMYYIMYSNLHVLITQVYTRGQSIAD